MEREGRIGDANDDGESGEMEGAGVATDLHLSLATRGWEVLDFPPDQGTSMDEVRMEDQIAHENGGISSSNAQGVGLENKDFLELGRGSFQRDVHHKRPKILLHGGKHSSLSPHNCNAEPALPFESEDEDILPESTVIYYYSKDTGAKDPMVLSTEDDNEDDIDKSNVDDFEVRMDLTEDLLHMVFSFLTHKDLCRAGATCKTWHAASSHEDFWRYLNFEDTNISSLNFAAICGRYPNATRVNIMGTPEVEVLVTQAMESLRRLEFLKLGQGQGQLGDRFFQALNNCNLLRSLSINDTSLGSVIQEITVQHDRLVELEIVKCRVLRVSIRCPQLEKLSLRRTTMAQALLTCPQLQFLDLSSCHKLSDAGIRSVATSCQLLTSLDISFCSCVTDETLREIAFVCPNLQYLNASFCPNISFESVRLPMLTNLMLQSCEGISSASVAAISHSSMLEALQLDMCNLLTSVSLDLPHLQNISLVHCRKFVDLNLRCPALSLIKVSNCPALHRISIISNTLQKLVLQKQESLATLNLNCQSLQEVDLADCESLTNSVCDVFSDRGGCPALTSLTLDNCESLTDVRLVSSSLAKLSLIGCRAVIKLDLSCPSLQNVNLDGCDHLERVFFRPVGLQSLNLGICPKLSSLEIEAPNMEVLDLQGCGVLSEATINCPLLLSLDASFCSQLKDESLSAIVTSCAQIESLVLSSCLSVGFDGLSSLSCLKYLLVLDLSYTFLVDLEPVFQSCAQLVTLKLMACKYLTDSSLDALYKKGALPALRELDLSYSSVGQAAIEGLLNCCTNLTNVNLNGCANMHDLVWGSSNGMESNFLMHRCTSEPSEAEHHSRREPDRLLEILNCVGCSNIKKVKIPLLARCLYLTKLKLHLSANLKEVDIACLSLSSLDLSQCSSLESLKLNCPKLGILLLVACGMISEAVVETAISGCSSLETLNLQQCPKFHASNMERLRLACPSLKRIYSSPWD